MLTLYNSSISQLIVYEQFPTCSFIYASLQQILISLILCYKAPFYCCLTTTDVLDCSFSFGNKISLDHYYDLAHTFH